MESEPDERLLPRFVVVAAIVAFAVTMIITVLNDRKVTNPMAACATLMSNLSHSQDVHSGFLTAPVFVRPKAAGTESSGPKKNPRWRIWTELLSHQRSFL